MGDFLRVVVVCVSDTFSPLYQILLAIKNKSIMCYKKTLAMKRISRLVGEATTSSNVLLPHKAQNKAGWVSSRNSSGGHATKRDLSAYQDYDERSWLAIKLARHFCL
jgi:hypothetical protein